MKGQHKVSVTVEIDGEDTLTFQEEFSSGNPAFHAAEFVSAAMKPVGRIKKALESVFGIKPGERDGIGRKTYKELDTRIEAAEREGAKVFRVLFLTGSGITLWSEPMYQNQLANRWDEFRNYPGLTVNKVEYGVPTSEKFKYDWSAL